MYFFSPIVFNVRCEAIATPFYASVVFELLVGKRAVSDQTDHLLAATYR
jgi:hypothetical protein